MIKNLRIKNFKALSELNINDISRVNLIGGCNNVGETSLLEAFFVS
jgi:AAA15 family ATPase/GTPase